MSKRDYDHQFKLVMVGDTGVGKSSLLLRFTDNTFSDSQTSTIGVDFRFRSVKVDKKVVKLQIWDTAGQERYKTITSAYYRGAHGIIVVFDVANQESFTHVNEWLMEVNRYASETSAKLLIGNKTDLPNRVITTESAKAFADTLNIQYIETSAVSSSNVETAFEIITKALLESKLGTTSVNKESTTIKNLQQDTAGRSSSKGSCC